MSTNLQELDRRLWATANQLWANTGLRPSDFSVPVLGLIFLRYADKRFQDTSKKLGGGSGRRTVGKVDYQAEGVIYLPEKARFGHLLKLPEGDNIGKAINEAMVAIEDENTDLKGILPRTYTAIENAVLVELLKQLAPLEIDGDAFGQVYEYFLGNFAMAEGQKGGVFYTPTSIVRLIVEIIEPYHGLIYDPACGSGGMFVQSADFIEAHKKNPANELRIFGVEKDATTVKLAKMNLAVHGLSGEIIEGNTYYSDPHHATEGKTGRFDFVMANPPFNVKGVDYERLTQDSRFRLGLPSTNNANYIWIQTFYSALSDHGRAGFVMANSAADARGSELEIRKKLIQDNAVDVVVSIGPNFFYTVSLACTLWFFDRGKRGTAREDKVLFIDARDVFRQIDRAHRDFEPWQIEYLANIVRMYRGADPELIEGSADRLKEEFPERTYRDVAGRCKAATLAEVEEQGWSLNPGRYVGVGAVDEDELDFEIRWEELVEGFETLCGEADDLADRVRQSIRSIDAGVRG